MQGRVLKIHGGFYEVMTDKRQIICRLRGKNKLAKESILPGDIVELSLVNESEGNIEKVYKRKNHIHRPAVANLDMLLLVTSYRQPEPDFLLLDRLLALSCYNHIKPLICFNKKDLTNEIDLPYEYYKKSEFQVLSLSVKESSSFMQLTQALQDKVTVMAGNSGVGKSTILNALMETSIQTTAAVSHKLSRGRHTTRTVSFFPFVHGFVADTPGFNILNLPTEIDALTFSKLYPEYLMLVDNCKYSNCLHDNEPGCAVKSAVEEKFLSEHRYHNYRILLKEIKSAQRSDWRK